MLRLGVLLVVAGRGFGLFPPLSAGELVPSLCVETWNKVSVGGSKDGISDGACAVSLVPFAKGNFSLGTQSLTPLTPSNCHCPLGSHKDALFRGCVGPVT